MNKDSYDNIEHTINCDSLVSDFINDNHVVRCGKTYYIYSSETGIYYKETISELQIMVAQYYETVTENVYNVKHSRQISELLRVRTPRVNTMNEDKCIICLKNCVIDLSSGDVFEHSPEFRFINRIEVDYDPDAKCPVFNKFLRQICMNNAKRKRTLEEFMGLCLTKDIGYGTALVLKGNGANGKSVYANILCALVGEGSYTSLVLDDLSNFGSGKIPGKKLAIMTEISRDSSSSIMTNELKQIITGELMDCNVKYQQNVDMRPFCKVLILTNHGVGFLNDNSEGTLRRILVLPMEYFVPVSERDYQLEDKMIKELSGIFNIAMNGYMRLRDNGYVYSSKEESDSLLNDLLMYEDPLKAFVRSNVAQKKGSFITYNDFYTHYNRWCNKNGVTCDVGKEKSIQSKKAAFSKQVFNEISNYYYVERSMRNGERGVKNVYLLNS